MTFELRLIRPLSLRTSGLVISKEGGGLTVEYFDGHKRVSAHFNGEAREQVMYSLHKVSKMIYYALDHSLESDEDADWLRYIEGLLGLKFIVRPSDAKGQVRVDVWHNVDPDLTVTGTVSSSELIEFAANCSQLLPGDE